MSKAILRASRYPKDFNLKMHEGQSIYEHCKIMVKDIEELGKLGLEIQKEL